MWAYSGTVPPCYFYRWPLTILPNSLTGDSCAHWMHYGEVTKSREGWARSLLDEFKSNVELLKCAVRDQQGPPAAHGSPQHGKHLARTHCLVVRTRTEQHPSGFSVLQCPVGMRYMSL